MSRREIKDSQRADPLLARELHTILNLAVESSLGSGRLSRRREGSNTITERHAVDVAREGASDDLAESPQAVGKVLIIQYGYGEERKRMLRASECQSKGDRQVNDVSTAQVTHRRGQGR